MSGSGGSVRQRKPDQWEGRYRVDGRAKSVYGRTKRETQEKLRAALTQAGAGVKPTTTRLTVAAYLTDWLEASVKPQRRATTYASYEDTVRRFLIPAIGRHPLTKLEPGHVQRMLADLSTRETARGRLSPTTVRYCYTILRVALGRAYKQGLVVRNVATLVDAPSKANVEMHPLSAEQARTFLASVSAGPREALYVTALYTGLRQGELLGLRWQDVDLEGAVLAVRHTLQRRTHELGEPKTERGRRTLRLPGDAVAALPRHKVAQLEQRLRAGRKWQDHDLVFTTSLGTPLDARNVTRLLQAALERAGLPRQRFHDLRHAYATLLLEAGEELAVVSKMLGHADLGTTADVYAHLTRGMQDRAAARMDAILGRAATG